MMTQRSTAFLRGTRPSLPLQALILHLPANRKADVMFPCHAHDPGFFVVAMDRDKIEPAPHHTVLTFAVAILVLVRTTGFSMAVS